MKKHNPANERIKRKYFAFLKEAKRHSEPTIDAAAKALNRFEVYTKFRDFKTFHFKQAIAFKKHLAQEIHEIVAEWVSYLRDENLWGNDDPLFPATRIAVGASHHFEAAGLARKHWSNATPIRTIFKDAFTTAGLPYFNPHSFRDTLANLGEQVCKTPEHFKAWSQNLGHEKVLTTFLSYGEVACRRQGDIIRDLAKSQGTMNTSTDGIAEALLKRLNRAGVNI
jgi:hypothetical protein